MSETRARSIPCVAALLAGLFAAPVSARTGTGDPAEVFRERGPDDALVLHGHLRLRSAAFFNLDLDRGPSPTTGLPLFPEGEPGPGAGSVVGHDARVRIRPSLFLGDELRVFLDVDVLTASLGVPPVSGPFQGFGADAAARFLDVRAAGVDWMLPFGVLSLGRMPAHFALGIAANDGADLDDDGGDRADRLALVLPVFGHLLAGAVDLLPETSLLGEQAVTVGIMKWRAPWEVELYRKAGRAVLDWGLAASWGWQSKDAPGLWSSLAADPGRVRRDARFVLADAWLRLVWGPFRLEAEGWASDLLIENPSPLAGVTIRQPITGNPAAFALIGELRAFDDDSLRFVLETGAASADPAPGFPVAEPTGFSGAQPGDAFGAQVDLKRGGDSRFDSGRIHPLHRIDLILWRTLLGGVSEAAYARGQVKGRPLEWLALEGNLVYSHALSPDSAPGGRAPLGVELDLAAEAALDHHGLGVSSIRLDVGTLAPLGGLGARGGAPPGWAHMILVRLGHAL
jgi:hypothetical protein